MCKSTFMGSRILILHLFFRIPNKPTIALHISDSILHILQYPRDIFLDKKNISSATFPFVCGGCPTLPHNTDEIRTSILLVIQLLIVYHNFPRLLILNLKFCCPVACCFVSFSKLLENRRLFFTLFCCIWTSTVKCTAHKIFRSNRLFSF